MKAYSIGLYEKAMPNTLTWKEKLEAAKEELTVRILQEQIAKPRMTEEEVRFWICRFRELDTTKEEHRQRLIDSFVNAVYVYDDNILLIYNYKDGQETVPLKEANDSVLSGSCVPKIAESA